MWWQATYQADLEVTVNASRSQDMEPKKSCQIIVSKISVYKIATYQCAIAEERIRRLQFQKTLSVTSKSHSECW